MTIEQDSGAPFDENAQTVIKTNANYTAKKGDDIICVYGSSNLLAVYLPARPFVGETHRIVGEGVNVTVNGGPNPIAGLNNLVFGNTAVDYTFSSGDVWVNSCCGASRD